MNYEVTTENIPTDVASLQQLVLTLQEKYESLIQEKNQEIALYRHKLQKQLNARYGRKSEKCTRQLELFDEADLPEQPELAAIEQADSEITIAAHTRQKSGRKPLPASLPREQIIHDLADKDKTCACGTSLHKIGDEISEQLEYIPAQVKVIQHVRFKYACRKCEEGVKTAPMPCLPIPKSIATPGLLAEILISKYLDHLPLYRQESILKRMGVDLSRTTLSTWMIKCGELLAPLVKQLKQTVLDNNYIQADETTLQVLNESGKANTSKSYMWVFKGGPPNKPVVVYEYHPTRSGSVATDFLTEFTGALQCDAYSGYMQFKTSSDINLYLCFAHARRKYADIVKANKSKKTKANIAIDYIAKLYKVEDYARKNNLTCLQRQKLRTEKSIPILERFKAWLEQTAQSVPPTSPIGNAIAYSLSHWQHLSSYVHNGEVEIDNNKVENLIRPFALGRKNWLFHGSPRGANAGATIYSLMMTCKLNHVEPYAYFKYVLAKIRTWDESKLEQLLPQNIDQETIAAAYTTPLII